MPLWFPVLGWMLFIFWLSSLPSPQPTKTILWDWVIHKLGHLFVYAVLFVLCFRGSKNIKISFLICLLYALSDEFHQSFVPTRTASFWDVLIDALGVAIGLYCLNKTKIMLKMNQS